MNKKLLYAAVICCTIAPYSYCKDDGTIEDHIFNRAMTPSLSDQEEFVQAVDGMVNAGDDIGNPETNGLLTTLKEIQSRTQAAGIPSLLTEDVRQEAQTISKELFGSQEYRDAFDEARKISQESPGSKEAQEAWERVKMKGIEGLCAQMARRSSFRCTGNLQQSEDHYRRGLEVNKAADPKDTPCYLALLFLMFGHRAHRIDQLIESSEA